MTRANSLPARPNLAYLKKLAKQRQRAMRGAGGGKVSARLASAQLAIAREYGFASWRALKTHVDSVSSAAATVADGLAAKADAFLDAAVSHSMNEPVMKLRRAEKLLAEEPRIAAANLLTACVLGDAKAAGEFLERTPTSVAAAGGPRNWPPILYLCFSRYLKFRPRREAAFVRVAKMLLERGADANSLFVHEGFNETALFGAAGIANRPKLTRVLLDAGADPNDGSESSGLESLYHAAEHADNACLKLLLRKKPRPDAVSYCLFRKLDFEDAGGAKLMLNHGADPNFRGPAGQTSVLHAIRRGRSVAIVKLLHARGAKLDLPDKDGMTPPKLAGRLGRKDVVKFLRGNGVAEEVEPKEEFLAALAGGNLRRARKILAANPGLMDRLTPDDQRVLPDAAADNRIWPVRHMLDLGFDINVKGDWGGSPIHQAAWRGHVAMAKFLIARGADLHQKNDFGGEVLGAAVHGAVHAGHRHGLAMILLIARALKITDLSPHIEWALDDLDPKIVEGLSKAAGAPAKTVRSSALWKPLMDAAFRGDSAMVRKLLAAGADPNVVSTTAHRYRPLNRAIERKKLTPRGPEHQEVVRALLEGGADPKLRGGFGQLTALQQAAQDAAAFIPLLRERFEPLDIFHAAAVGDDRRVQALLRNEPKLATAKDENGRQPLHYCCASAMYELGESETAALVRVARTLLKHGAEPSATVATQEKWPLPPLYFCCGAHNNPAVAKVLFDAGATPFDGETVYHAADENHRECLDLIERYADPKKLAAECTRCIGYQLHWGFSRGAPWLLSHGADPNALREDFGDSALHAAVKARCNDDIIRLILKHGGDPKRKNAGGKSAIDLAARTPRIARLFKSAER